MKKILTAAALWLCALPVWAFSAAELAQTLGKPENVQGHFVQQRYLKSVAKPMTAKGTFVLKRGSGLLWLMEKPFDSRLRVSRNGGIEQWRAGVWTKTQGAQAVQHRQIALFLDLLSGDTKGLEQQFELQLGGTEKQWQLRLLPKSVLMKQIFNRIDISGDSVVRRLELDEKQGDRTVMLFQQVQTGRPLNAFARESL